MVHIFDYILQFRYILAKGLLMTVWITALSVSIGLLIGFGISLCRISRLRMLRIASSVFVDVIRGLPVLVQLFWAFFVIPILFHANISSLTAAVATLTIYMGVISSESFRLAAQTIGREQFDACSALGMGYWTRSLFVIFPQTALAAIPPVVSNILSLFKESALVSALGVAELMFVGENIALRTARPSILLSIVAIIYFVFGFALARLAKYAEFRIRKRTAL